jgi:hypothetical protein
MQNDGLKSILSSLTTEIQFLRKSVDRLQLEQEAAIATLRQLVPGFSENYNEGYRAFAARPGALSEDSLATLKEIALQLQSGTFRSSPTRFQMLSLTACFSLFGCVGTWGIFRFVPSPWNYISVPIFLTVVVVCVPQAIDCLVRLSRA